MENSQPTSCSLCQSPLDFTVACSAAFFSRNRLRLLTKGLCADSRFFFLDFFPAGLTGYDPGTALSRVTLLAGRIHFTKTHFPSFL